MVEKLLCLGEMEHLNVLTFKGDDIQLIYMQFQYVGELILMGRNSPCFCGSGRKVKHCHPDVNEESLVAKMLQLYSLVDKRNALGLSSPCQKGCANCCTDDFDVHFSEFLVVLSYLNIGHEYSRYRQWKRLIAEWNPKVTGVCFFLHREDNTCRIYTVRPLVCRNYGTTLQFTEKPCALISDPAALLDESAYPEIDAKTNRILMAGKQGTFNVPELPLTLWMEKPDENGLLKAERMRDLLQASTKSSVDDFVRILTIP